MRVTKIIREYVEREISQKFESQYDGLGTEYRDVHSTLETRLREIRDRAEAEALKVAAEYGFTRRSGYMGARSVIGLDMIALDNEELRTRDEKKRRAIDERKEKAIESILLDLELGATTKAELKDAIEAVEV